MLALVTAAATSAHADAPLALSAATHGSTLDLTFTNTSTKPVTFTTHVRAGLDHHDDLTVELAGPKGRRTMTFWESRTKAIPVEETIAPGKQLTRHIDLVTWSLRGDNKGGPLEAGRYRVAVTWDMTKASSGPTQKLAATTTLVLPEATETACTEPPAVATAKLELLATQQPPGATVQVGLHNSDAVAHCVFGIVRTHETQSDWLAISIPTGKATLAIRLSGDRDKSYPVAYLLPPGATLWTRWDLALWAGRIRGAKLPAKQTVWATAAWDASRETTVWRGTATTGFQLALP